MNTHDKYVINFYREFSRNGVRRVSVKLLTKESEDVLHGILVRFVERK